MGLFIDELTLVVPGNIVKKAVNGGKDSALRISRQQLDDLEAAVAEARQVFGNSKGTPVEEVTGGTAKTAETAASSA